MTSGYLAVLDACVLVNAALRDTLLRLAEAPPLYLPRWSAEIMDEMTRTLENNLNYTSTQTEHLVEQLQTHFSEAWVEGYEPLISAMANHPNDRHVLAAAVKTGAQTIVTVNLKDFPKEALSPWDVQAQHPDAFLIDQYHLAPEIVVMKLVEQGAALKGGLSLVLTAHSKIVPEFTAIIQGHMETDARLNRILELSRPENA